MALKQKTGLAIYAATVLLLYTLSPVQGHTTLELQAYDILASLFTEAEKIINLTEKIDKKDQESLQVLCNGCKKYKLFCATLTGHLCASQDNKNLNKLKDALQEQKPQEIKAIIASIANEKQIKCTLCQKFVAWT